MRKILLITAFFIVCVPSSAWPLESDRQCLSCHREIKETYLQSRHGVVFGMKQAEGGCESCHGPVKEHLDAVDREDKDLRIENFRTESGSKAADRCLACHERGATVYWKGSAHRLAGVNCFSCHKVHAPGQEAGMDLCFSCHQDKRGQVLKSSHMPLREGKMSCTSCHNPHGSFGPRMLKTPTVNETCYACHTEKRGPFLWEHAPVRENCATCHDPHGSNNPGLLKSKGPFLCTQCHQYGGHVNVPRYNRASATYGKGCINCHTRVHGSNHPSGVKFTR